MKIITLSAELLLASGLTSYKKNFECDCVGAVTQTYTDPDDSFWNGSYDASFTQTMKEKQKDAEEKCSAYDENTTSNETDVFGAYTETTTVACTLEKK